MRHAGKRATYGSGSPSPRGLPPARSEHHAGLGDRSRDTSLLRSRHNQTQYIGRTRSRQLHTRPRRRLHKHRRPLPHKEHQPAGLHSLRLETHRRPGRTPRSQRTQMDCNSRLRHRSQVRPTEPNKRSDAPHGAILARRPLRSANTHRNARPSRTRDGPDHPQQTRPTTSPTFPNRQCLLRRSTIAKPTVHRLHSQLLRQSQKQRRSVITQPRPHHWPESSPHIARSPTRSDGRLRTPHPRPDRSNRNRRPDARMGTRFRHRTDGQQQPPNLHAASIARSTRHQARSQNRASHSPAHRPHQSTAISQLTSTSPRHHIHSVHR